MTQEASAAAPYAHGPWLFSHNGRVEGWPQALEALAASLPPARLLALEARVDSALLWALVLERLAAGDCAGDALAHVVNNVSAVTGARLNFLLTDGTVIAATAAGDTLFWRTGPGSVVVASEPFDDSPDWHEVADNSLLTATVGYVDVRPIPNLTKEQVAP
jgi:glutamine amidotransferase